MILFPSKNSDLFIIVFYSIIGEDQGQGHCGQHFCAKEWIQTRGHVLKPAAALYLILHPACVWGAAAVPPVLQTSHSSGLVHHTGLLGSQFGQY